MKTIKRWLFLQRYTNGNTHMKRYSISLVTGKIQIKTTKYYLTYIRMAIIKKTENNKRRCSAEKLKLLSTAGENVK